jgi:hypothetical protein
MNKCSREDSNLHGFPHTVLSRTRLPVPPRERERWEAIGEMPDVKKIEKVTRREEKEGTERIVNHKGTKGTEVKTGKILQIWQTRI